MMLHIPGVLSPAEVLHLREQLDAAGWANGALTAGSQAAHSKRNLQLSPDHPAFAELSESVRTALARHPLFIAAALPAHILPPMFNCYQGGGTYGNHVDNTVQQDRFTRQTVRTDVSTTVFLSDPDDYQGGELVVEDTYGTHEVKLAAGDAIVYPSTSLHRVEPVTQGRRLAAFLWTQSLVRDAWQRSMLFELDMTILKLRQQLGDSAEVLKLTHHYHNLLRQWGEP